MQTVFHLHLSGRHTSDLPHKAICTTDLARKWVSALRLALADHKRGAKCPVWKTQPGPLVQHFASNACHSPASTGEAYPGWGRTR